MSTVGGGVNIVKDGLVLYLDAANNKSLEDVPSTNLVAWSEDFTNGTWNKISTTTIANSITSPSRLQDADTFTANGASAFHYMYNVAALSSGITYSISIYAKKGTNNFIQLAGGTIAFGTNFYANFDLDKGALGTVGPTATASIKSADNGWYRCTVTGTTIGNITSDAFAVFGIVQSATSVRAEVNVLTTNLYLWGAQLEQGPVATTYIPTTTTSASRVPVWSDVSKGGNNGTLTSGFTYNYSNGGSLIFDGVNDRVQTTYSPLFGDFTVCLIFKDNGSGQWGRIVDKGYQTGFFISSHFASIGANYVGAGIIEPNPPHGIALPYASGKYHFFASVRNGTTHTIYLDGISQTTNKTVSSNLLNNQSIAFGTWNNSTQQPFKGDLPYVQIYNRALTEQEVLQNFNATKTRFGL